jgi:hypothetical protein
MVLAEDVEMLRRRERFIEDDSSGVASCICRQEEKKEGRSEYHKSRDWIFLYKGRSVTTFR